MRLLNIVVTGLAERKKSALIKGFSDHTFNSPEQAAIGKEGKKYKVEFGRANVDPKTVLYLAGVPADEQFDFVWERLADGLLGILVVIDTKADKSGVKELVARVKEMTDTPFVAVFIGMIDRRDPEAVALRKELGIPREEQVVCGASAGKETAKSAVSKLLELGVKLRKKVMA